MKGKIFIAWSGDNTLATNVAMQLARQEYNGVVGGESGINSNIYVGATVIREIDQCNQAIFIVQKKESVGISGNLLFELGYALSRFDGKKIHVFYVDIERGNSIIPSDLEGIWANFITFTNMNNTAALIVEKFLNNQKTIIPEDKMSVIDSYYNIKSKIANYPTSPYCSEYEFAQYILFFTLSAYMFQSEEETIHTFKSLSSELKNPSEELQQALIFGICYMKMFNSIKKEEDTIYIERSLFREIVSDLKNLIMSVQNWSSEDNDFQLWFLTLLYDVTNYLHILYSYNPQINGDLYVQILQNSISYAKKCLECCEKLSKKPENIQCVHLFKAYMYRNLSIAYKKPNIDNTDASDLEKCIECLKLSLDERQKLWMYYKNHNINTKLFENFELEYYLAMCEYLPYVDDKLEQEEMRLDCVDYIERMEKSQKEQNFFINKINSLVKG